MFYDNLKTICDEQGVKITSIVLECGGAKGSISNWKKGASPNSDIVAKLAVRLNVSTDKLILGKEPEKKLSDDEETLLQYFNHLSIENKIRVIERAATLAELEISVEDSDPEEPETRFIEYSTLKVSAGTGQYLDTGLMEQMKIIKNELTADASFAVKITGDSMEPLYEDGEIVLVKSQPTVELGEVGIFIVGGLGYIKKLGEDRLISVNPYYNDILFHEEDEIYCKGLVIGVLEDEDILD